MLSGRNPNANPNPYFIPVKVLPDDITGEKWVEMSNNVNRCVFRMTLYRRAANTGQAGESLLPAFVANSNLARRRRLTRP